MNKKQAQGNSSLKRSLNLILAGMASLRDVSNREFEEQQGGGTANQINITKLDLAQNYTCNQLVFFLLYSLTMLFLYG
ncbi:hypothetical protein L21SP5_01315 [Salinivirga cyanobacteriivorans]|uniref:Uncharacterized protein n=1 Tax=Salinivirga cyanobacteriivorans TaxID=1307839 RepID=A0A0S2HY77_9BACT|nr:hypothetical protein L21SP5_01315 [Salinivirga cyanobacteriivorans]